VIEVQGHSVEVFVGVNAWIGCVVSQRQAQLPEVRHLRQHAPDQTRRVGLAQRLRTMSSRPVRPRKASQPRNEVIPSTRRNYQHQGYTNNEGMI